jgi:anaerobic magnesium-protoporphyrin IX monomethyl ester cyclase
MKLKILLVYPNLPLMMSPAMSMGLFNAIGKRMDCEVELFETTQYSEQYNNRHIRMTEIGASRQNKDDEIQDMFWIKDPDQIIPDFVNKVETFEPDLLLVSVQEDVWRMTTRLMDSISHLDIPHVLGGQFPTNAPDVVINWPSVNCIARHEGENIVVDIINELQKGNDIKTVKGLWFKEENVIKRNAPAQLCNISNTIPNYDCFDGVRWKRPMGGNIFQRAISMETYRGCPYNCTYCNSPTTRNLAKDFQIGNFMRRKSADVIEKELLHYIDLYDPDLIMFQDDSFLARPAKEIFEFCEMWSKYKIPFWFNTRIENCKPEYLEALKEAGVYRMTFGVESGNEEYRSKVLKRNANNYTYHKFLDYINDSNIPYSLNVILGMPFETREMVMDTAEFIHRARGYDGLTISMWQPYWGTDLRKQAEKAGFLDPKYICGWESKSALGGGFMDDWVIRMPEPFLQPDDVHKLVKTFALYAHFGPEKFEIVECAETDEKLYKELFNTYKQEFFGDIQEGGADRIQRFCAMHDSSSTYNFETV